MTQLSYTHGLRLAKCETLVCWGLCCFHRKEVLHNILSQHFYIAISLVMEHNASQDTFKGTLYTNE